MSLMANNLNYFEHIVSYIESLISGSIAFLKSSIIVLPSEAFNNSNSSKVHFDHFIWFIREITNIISGYFHVAFDGIFHESKKGYNEIINKPNLQHFYYKIFESDFLPYTSFILISSSILCLITVLYNVKISYPSITSSQKDEDHLQIDKNGNITPSSPQRHQQHQQRNSISPDRNVREDLVNFATAKV